MKNLIFILSIIFLFALLITPFIVGDLEKETLNAVNRKILPGKFVKLSSGITHYDLQGAENSQTVVLVHGNAAPYCTWDYTADELVKAGYKVLRYDIYGHGFSDRPNLKAYDRDLYDKQLEELLTSLNIKEKIYLVGTSQGGTICAYFVAKHPQKVAKVALLAPLFDDFTGKFFWGIMKNKFVGEYLIRIVGDKFFTNPEKVLQTDAKVAELREKLLQQMHYKDKKRAVLANIRGNALDDPTEYYTEMGKQDIPVLLTWAEDDKSVSGASMERLCKLLPQIQYYKISQASHLAHYEFPERLNPLLLSFFEKKE